MSRVAKVIVASENKTGSGIKAAAQTINGFGRDVQKVGNLISKAFVVTAVAGFAKKLASVAADMESAWAQQEKALLGFEAAMRGATQISSSGASGLKAFAQSMASLVGVDDQVILSLETLLATSGRTEDQIRMIINAAADMSAATGKDLKASVEQLNKTFGGTAGELGEILPAMKGLTKEQLLAGDAVELVAGQYKGMAEALSGSAQVSIDNYTNAVGDLKESLGALISEGMTPLRSWLTDLTRQWTAAIDVARSYAKVQNAIASKDMGALVLLSDSDLKAATEKQEQIARDMYAAIVKGGSYDMGGGLEVKGPMLKSAYGAATDQLQTMRQESDRRSAAAPAASTGSAPAAGGKPAGPSDEEKAWDAFIEANRVGWRPVDSGIGDDADIAAMMESFTMSSEERILAANEALLAGMQNNPASISEGGSIFGGADMSFGALLGEALGIDEIPGMFADFAGSLGNLQAILNPIQTILQGMFDVLGPLLEDLLAPISGMLQIFGQIIAQTLIPVINILTPVIEGLAKMMVWFANKIMIPVGNFIIGIWNGIVDAINAALGWAGVSIARASLINPVALSDAKAAGQSTSTYGTTSSSGASYAGAQSITFNFYNQGNVVGSGGLEELALLIDSILQRNARYA